jgi:fluoride ion exporter CrcB/FEX
MHDGNGLVEVASGIAMPLFAFIVGYDLVSEVDELVPSKRWMIFDKILALVVFVAGLVSLTVIGAIGGSGTITRDHVISCALGPIGSLCRWGLALLLNHRFAAGGNKFRSGTFIANSIAVAITGLLRYYAYDSVWTIYIVTGICGSLSTVSSWVSDTMSIHRGPCSWGWAYVYCVVSVLFCSIIMIPFSQ